MSTNCRPVLLLSQVGIVLAIAVESAVWHLPASIYLQNFSYLPRLFWSCASFFTKLLIFLRMDGCGHMIDR